MVCAFLHLCLVYWYSSIRYFVKIGFWWLALRWPSESLRLEEGWWAVDINIGQNTSIKQYNSSTLYRHHLHTNMQRSNMTKYRSNKWSDSDLRMRDSLLLLCLSNDAMFQRVQKFILTRPKPAYGRQGLDWIVGPGYSFVVFLTNKTMETNQKPWKTMEIKQKPWNHLEKPWIPTKNHYKPWNHLGKPWKPTKNHDKP